MAKSGEKTTDSAVLACTCQHEAQDRIYGKGKRLHTWGRKRAGKGPGFACTVCSHFVPGMA